MKDHGLAAIEWKSLSQVSLLSPGTASGTLMLLSGKLLSDALKVQSLEGFLRTALSRDSGRVIGPMDWAGAACPWTGMGTHRGTWAAGAGVHGL
jgi:hypothetical protein